MPNNSPQPPKPLTLSSAEEKAYRDHDLRQVAWSFLSEIRHSADFLKYSAPAASMMRVILAQGEEPPDRAIALAETAVIGSILHGIAPRDAEQWAIAERLYDEARLEDFRHWTPVLGYFGHAPREDTDEFCSCGCRWRRPGTGERGTGSR
jgi:hypothetical protein